MGELAAVALKAAVALAEKAAPKLLLLLALVDLRFGGAAGEFFIGLANQLAARLVANNPQAAAATAQLGTALGRALLADYRVVAVTVLGCALAVLGFAGLPLAYKALGRRRQLVFVSFNHLRESVARGVQAALQRAGADVRRIPFDEAATHQAIVGSAVDGIRACHGMVCIPGRSASYVEHEVLAATTAGKPVVFVVSEDSGTLPNTADKRYPVFKLETTGRCGFEPLVAFLSYIDADLRSTWALCRAAFRHPFMSASATAVAWGLGGALLALWGWRLVEVVRLGSAIAATVPNGADVRSAALFAHGLLLGTLLAVAALCGCFCVLFVVNLVQQFHARSRARLKTAAARFDRADWLGVVPGLSRDGLLYACLFDSAPAAHHEAG